MLYILLYSLFKKNHNRSNFVLNIILTIIDTKNVTVLQYCNITAFKNKENNNRIDKMFKIYPIILKLLPSCNANFIKQPSQIQTVLLCENNEKSSTETAPVAAESGQQ